jgi:cold shock protein
MASGTVKWFNAQKGYGFIQPAAGGPDIFVHISAVERAGMSGLNEGQKVSYEAAPASRQLTSSRQNNEPHLVHRVALTKRSFGVWGTRVRVSIYF